MRRPGMNLPIFLVVLPAAFVSATYFPLGHPVLAAISTVNPLYHLAEGVRGLLLGGRTGHHLELLAALLAAMLIGLVPVDMVSLLTSGRAARSAAPLRRTLGSRGAVPPRWTRAAAGRGCR